MTSTRESEANKEKRDGFRMEYLGDAVYASFDGYQVWLHLNSHRSPPLIALEPSVILKLVRYYDSVTNKEKKENE